MARAEVLDRRSVGLQEKCQSDFRLEYGINSSDQALFDDVVSYLGEYRFSLPKFSYTLKFFNGKLRDPHRGDSMRDIIQRAIGSKSSEGSFYSRELAEKQGIVSLDSQLLRAKEGDSIVWASPPGPKEDGYGDYGFIFFGNVTVDNTSEKTIQMTAVRMEHPAIEQFNQAMNLLTGQKANYKNAEEFLANPKVFNEHLQEGHMDAVLGMSFAFKPNAQEQAKFKLIIQKMFPLISDFIQSAKDPWKSKSEKLKELYALENYALKLKREYGQILTGKEKVIADFKPLPRLAGIVGEYGKPPPQVAGSCPANNNNNKKNSLTTSNILSRGSFLDKLLGDQEWFHCPKCGYQADGPVGNTCPGCSLTKEKYKQETGISCN